MRWFLGWVSLFMAALILLLLGWDIHQLYGPNYQPTTIFSWFGHGPIELLWGFYIVLAAILITDAVYLFRSSPR